MEHRQPPKNRIAFFFLSVILFISPLGGYKEEIVMPHHHTKDVLNRLSRAIGHLEAIKKMVENGQDCSEVLIQLAAVKSAVNNTGKVILKDHIQHCIVDAVENGNQQAIDDLSAAIDQFMK